MAKWRNRAPVWFWVVVLVFVLWGVAGVFAFYQDVAATPDQLAKLTAYDRALLASRPSWFIWVYGGAVWSGLIGSIILLARSGQCRPLFVISLLLVIVMFGYMFARTDLIAVKGIVVAAGFPVVIAAIAAFQIWFSGLAHRRGWTS